jgi:hypothetical protein
MSTPQEYWDACLIRGWRLHGTILNSMIIFKSITGKEIFDYDPRLLRIPRNGYPWSIHLRVFVADHLSKISKRLWEQPPEKDVMLLKKLKDSKYDTELDKLKNRELDNERSQLYRNRKKVGMSSLAASQRNSATDWNVVKGGKIGRRR